MAKELPTKILVLVDGSAQALDAVRYVVTVTSPECARIVLFHVGTGFPEVFWDMSLNPLYHTRKSGVMGWLADRQLEIGEFKEIAYKIVEKADFSPEQVSLRTQTQKAGILKDIVQESYEGYHALVVGRTGISRLKDWVLGSMAYKLVRKIKHIPLMVVGGHPSTDRILIALDDTIEAMRAVQSVATLASGRDAQVSLCHLLKIPSKHCGSGQQPNPTAEALAWFNYNCQKFQPIMEQAATRLVEGGIKTECISHDFICYQGNAIHKLTETALLGRFGTVVVGRRETTRLTQQLIRGRFSDQIIRSLQSIAVWVVS